MTTAYWDYNLWYFLLIPGGYFIDPWNDKETRWLEKTDFLFDLLVNLF